MKNPTFSIRLLALFAIVMTLGQPFALTAQPAPGGRKEKKPVPYRITRGDILGIEVLAGGDREFAATGKRVEALGTINLQYIQDIRLVGLTVAEAQQAIAEAYREGRFLRNPVVNVTVETYSQRYVFISGKVNAPGRQNIEPDVETTIMDVITKAGNFSETARGREVRLTRTMPDGQQKVHILDVESALKGRVRADSSDAAFVVQPDDVIYVPEKII